MQSGYGLQTKRKMKSRLNISSSTMYCNFQTWLGLQAKQKILIDDLIMTAWRPINNFQNIHEMRNRFTT